VIITKIEGQAIPLIGEDIDTDRIIPARFLKEITFENMGKYAFYDARFAEDGTLLDHPFNDPRFQGASILVAGRNFGCGSSREHAPQALKRYGIQAVLAPSFAEIFRGNCKAIGIATMTLSEAAVTSLQTAILEAPKQPVSVDLVNRQVVAGDMTLAVDMPDSHRQAFLSGTWESIGLLVANTELIRDKDRTLPY
jgi:3-isopropylmalate/(R)-2-methylmalate dehydratase small subunit